jgi:hypothetical protein
LGNVPKENGVRLRKWPQCRIVQLRCAADYDNAQRTLRLLTAGRRRERQCGDQQQCDKMPHSRGFSRNDGFSKHLDIS